jgi:hypothetical protein
LFGDRYKAVVVEGQDRYHYQTLMDYIHLNPVRARMIQPKKGQSVLDYPWSSLASAYAMLPKRRAKWLAAEAGFKAFDLEDTVSGRRKMAERLDRRAVEEEIKNCGVPALSDEVDTRCSHLRRGWFWGTQAFGERMRKLALALLKKEGAPKSRGYRKQVSVREHGEKQAAVWLVEGLKAAGLKRGELAGVKGSDPRKVLLADLLWRRMVVSQEWLAEKLVMKSAANVSQQIRRLERKKALAGVPDTLRMFLDETDAHTT